MDHLAFPPAMDKVSSCVLPSIGCCWGASRPVGITVGPQYSVICSLLTTYLLYTRLASVCLPWRGVSSDIFNHFKIWIVSCFVLQESEVSRVSLYVWRVGFSSAVCLLDVLSFTAFQLINFFHGSCDVYLNMGCQCQIQGLLDISPIDPNTSH